MMRYLYRGASEDHYKKTQGNLKPKLSTVFASCAHCGQEWAYCGSGICCGESATNEVVKHQFKQKGFPTSGISTTPHLHRAKFYATCGGKYKAGYIYRIDRSLFSSHGILEYIVSEIVPSPSVPEDDEIIIVARDFKEIPLEVIVSVDYFKT